MNPQTRSVDGISQPRPMAISARPAAGSTSTANSAKRPFSRPMSSAKASKSHGIPDWIQLPLIIAGGMLAGLAIQSPALGQAALVAYGILAVILRIPGRITFILAFLAMLATIILLVFIGDVYTAQNFATYTFLLLVVGVITLNRELKREGGRIYSRKTRY